MSLDNCGVYLLTFPDGRRYVGQSSQPTVRIAQHLAGVGGVTSTPNACRAEILITGLTWNQSIDYEARLIAKLDTTNPARGLNRASWSGGCRMSDRLREIRAANPILRAQDERRDAIEEQQRIAMRWQPTPRRVPGVGAWS